MRPFGGGAYAIICKHAAQYQCICVELSELFIEVRTIECIVLIFLRHNVTGVRFQRFNNFPPLRADNACANIFRLAKFCIRFVGLDAVLGVDNRHIPFAAKRHERSCALHKLRGKHGACVG